MKLVRIGNKAIGKGVPTFIIAEVGMNHDGNIRLAKRFIDSATDSGADAIKFQLHIAEAETIKDAPPPPYFKEEPRYEYFKRTAFSKSEWHDLKEYAESKGLEFLCSVFSIPAVDILEDIGVAAYKIPSGEVTNLPLLEYVAETNKPIILSSGMSTLSELHDAISTIRKHNKNIILMQCTSLYPCPYDKVGLNLINEFEEIFKLPVGISDHTTTVYIPIAAVALGACAVEKHFTLSKWLYGPDARFSLEPHEFKLMVDGVRAVDAAILNPVKKEELIRNSNIEAMRKIFQKSIVAEKDIPAGTVLKEDMISIKKPGTGLHPKYFNEIIGKRVKTFIKSRMPIRFEDIEW